MQFQFCTLFYLNEDQYIHEMTTNHRRKIESRMRKLQFANARGFNPEILWTSVFKAFDTINHELFFKKKLESG